MLVEMGPSRLAPTAGILKGHACGKITGWLPGSGRWRIPPDLCPGRPRLQGHHRTAALARVRGARRAGELPVTRDNKLHAGQTMRAEDWERSLAARLPSTTLRNR